MLVHVVEILLKPLPQNERVLLLRVWGLIPIVIHGWCAVRRNYSGALSMASRRLILWRRLVT